MPRGLSPLRATLVSMALLLPTTGLAAQADSTAETGVREFLAACRHDGGKLWGRSLCGRLVVVDPETGHAVATARPPAGQFEQRGSLWIGTMPPEMTSVANTATDWMGQRWSTVRGPVPEDRYDRISLLAHESFHRIQPDLGLSRMDALNDHLDERDGRYLLRLELHALAAALVAKGDAARHAVLDALTFRAARGRRYPGSDTLEASLEIQEGLAEYTGHRIAMSETGATLDRIVDATRRFENRSSFVRSLGYGTGPALGFSLDRFAPGWRTRIQAAGFSAQLAHAVRFVPPRGSRRSRRREGGPLRRNGARQGRRCPSAGARPPPRRLSEALDRGAGADSPGGTHGSELQPEHDYAAAGRGNDLSDRRLRRGLGQPRCVGRWGTGCGLARGRPGADSGGIQPDRLRALRRRLEADAEQRLGGAARYSGG